MTDRRRISLGLLRLLDICLLIFAFALTTVLIVHLQTRFSLFEFTTMRIRIVNFLIMGGTLYCCHLIFCASGLYSARRFSSGRAELRKVCKAVTLSVFCFLIITSVFSIRMITLQFLSLFWMFSLVILCAVRLVLRFASDHFRRSGRNLRYLLVLGTNERAISFARHLSQSAERGYRLLGFVDDTWPGIDAFNETGMPLIADFGGLKDYLRRNVVDEVAVFLPFASFYAHCQDVADLCRQQGIVMRFNSDPFGFATSRDGTEEFDGEQFTAIFTGRHDGWPALGKRILDIVLSLILLLILSPILLAAAIGIKLSSSGPVLFSQERIGVNKRRFRMFKFRTMVQDAEKQIAELEQHNCMDGPVFKMKDDPRITPIGKFLRGTSIDELPQLLNVLLSDMSLVGPRPLPIRDYEGFSLDWQRRRFSVKPGITCLWQIAGRSSITFEQWMRLDLKYMDEWTFWLDIRILLLTIPAVLRGSGAM